ncbi:hypothetical protein SPRG_14059 [Saprolegnia parasitica CBS 223.65]|uniref:Fe2OG dioxygenase domain-containing protein n=1 Tax=Saprolegnia parasitica (strain CBS 223.65) TaxID=695850 RepID=A0A067C326_SAPPC|nr:hypothetical protein SPRG_14059 [Saprolegnia parasitica CBS 223.65]KDO20966.1 hypothetical protein SPRG_14059 [Saprolegnia parasitica CBS 223.65]|eukprot:XP_012208356.1 hypothetical protein SPRG_14059 [Saprolegnia parasitica CBS 223.65]
MGKLLHALFVVVALAGYYYSELLQHHVLAPVARSLQLDSRLPAPSPVGRPYDAAACAAAASAHLTDVLPVQGFHVLCIRKTPHDTMQGLAYKEGLATAAPLPFETALDMGALRAELESYKQRWAFFSPTGDRLWQLSQLHAASLVYVFEGGQFIWPGIHVGHKRTIPNLHGLGDVVLETLAMTPLVFSVEEFLRDDEIDVILDLSKEHLAPSGVTLQDGDAGKPATEWRTSTTYFLPSHRHALVMGIDQRVQDLVKVPISHQEDVQVLRYEESQKYDHHTDYFPVESYQNSPDVVESIHHGFKNRMITVFWYMSDVADGGHTIFPRAGGLPLPDSMKDCTKGLKVAPKKRKVIVFYSMLPNGVNDPMSLHGGCPVLDGIKYSGNKWVWNKPRY